MKTITFIRHAQSVANAGGITMDHEVIPLSELGKVQAQALAAILEIRPSKIFVSEFFRTHETAKPFADKLSMAPDIHPLLNEFSSFDPVLLDGLNGEQRRPISDEYWQVSDPVKRMGKSAETFLEFTHRVELFKLDLPQMPNNAVLFGHGIWLGMLIWKLFGFSVNDSKSMKAFRRFQLGFPMPNCAVYTLMQSVDGSWRVQANEAIMRRVADVS